MVLVFGSINVDLVAQVGHLPGPGETVAGASFVIAPGGKGANQALAARHAGAPVALHGAVGDDAFAVAALANLQVAGVDLAGVMQVAGPTGVALVNVDARGENAITVVPGANAQARAAQVPAAALRAGTTVLLQLELPVTEVAALARRARSAGARVVLNGGTGVAGARRRARLRRRLPRERGRGRVLRAGAGVAGSAGSILCAQCRNDSARRPS